MSAVQGKRRTFKKFTFRGVDLDALLTMKPVEILPLLSSRTRRKFNRGLTRKPMALIKKLNKAKMEAPEHEKPEVVKTHLRDVSSHRRIYHPIVALPGKRLRPISCFASLFLASKSVA